MKRLSRWPLAATVLTTALGLAACDVEKEEEGRLPDVEVEGGKLPEYDVDAPDVDVGTQEKTITVPDVDIDMPEDDPAIDEPERPVTPTQ